MLVLSLGIYRTALAARNDRVQLSRPDGSVVILRLVAIDSRRESASFRVTGHGPDLVAAFGVAVVIPGMPDCSILVHHAKSKKCRVGFVVPNSVTVLRGKLVG